MKSILASLGALCAAVLVSAAPVPVDSTITAVTVYTDRAVVTRTGSVELPGGITELTFINLPQALNEHSLQVSGKGTAQALILDVASKQTYVDFTPNARVKELEDVLRGLQKQLRGLDDRNGVLQAQSVMLDRMETALFAPPTKDVPRPDLTQFTNSLTYLSEQKTRIVAEHAQLDEQREDFQNRLNATQNSLNELRGAGGCGYKTVTVRVSAPQAGNLAVSLSYTVPGASWVPSYDARVLSTERVVQLGYFGVVRQSTGEDWKDVALTLSTARPGFGGAAPALSTWNLDIFIARQIAAYGAMREDAVAKSLAMPAVVNMQAFTSNAPAEGGYGGMLDKKEKDAEMAAATIEAGATSASFKIATSASVPSDNSPQKVPITSARLAANPEYLTVPKRLTTAYAAFLADLNSAVYWPADFRIAETPLFLDAETARRLASACADIVAQLAAPAFWVHAASAVPKDLAVPAGTLFPHFLCIDFALCDDGEGRVEPKLIELQGFPTVAFFQALLTRTYPKHFEFPANFTSYFGGIDEAGYFAALRRAIIGDADPKETVLLEITPDQQKTRIDFAATDQALGIRPVDVSTVRKRGKKLFYDRDGVETPITRIYNRVIFDELLRKKPAMAFSFFDELDVQWAGHPNWYFRVSKHTLPFLKGPAIPPCHFVSDLRTIPADLENYVLKPLYSFAGLGVDITPTREKIAAVPNPHEWLLQRKVAYAPLLATPDGPAKAEVRLILAGDGTGWPKLLNKLVRLSKGAMHGVDFNKGRSWVGSSAGFHPAGSA